MLPVILCGGNVSRLWPLSQPKQFQKMFSHNTVFQNTLLRLKSSYVRPIIATNVQYKSLVMSELDALQEYRVILEPVKIGTAAAILIAILLCSENEIMLILPSDHYIGNLNNFYDSIEKASQIAKENNAIVTFGVKPREFNSEYGYINAAMDEIKKFAPELYHLCCANVKHCVPQEKLPYFNEQDFKGIEDISIDYLVIKKEENVAMIESDFNWMDVGTWNGILELSEKFDIRPTQHSLLEDNSNELNSIKSTHTQQNIPSKSLISFVNKIKEVKADKKKSNHGDFIVLF